MSDDWRTTSTHQLGLSGSTCARLARSGLTTLGDLTRRIDDRRPFDELPDLGVTRHHQILAAVRAYWRQRRAEADRRLEAIRAFYVEVHEARGGRDPEPPA